MDYKIWLDDQAFDPYTPMRHAPEGFKVATDVDSAIALVKIYGPPSFMDLDCDLANGKDVMEFLKWLDLNHHDSPPQWNVHSANIVATPNVNAFMTSWHKIVNDCPDNINNLYSVISDSITSD